MKICRVESERLDHPRVPQILVHVEDEAGNVGTGECWWGVATMMDGPRGDTLAPLVAAVDGLLGPKCLGMDADRIEKIWQTLMRYAYRYGDEGILRSALSGIDLALWDLLGRRLGVSAAQFLGGPIEDRVPVYASLPGQRQLAPLLREVERAYAAGFTAIKVHEFDPDLVLALREALGPEAILMVDALGHFSAHEAIPFARRLEAADLVFLETPIYPMRDYPSLERLRRATALQLAVGEHEWSLEGFERLLRSGAAEFVQPEITKLGGFSYARRVSALVEMHGKALSPHAYRWGPSLHATLLWAACSRATAWVEIPFLPEGIDFPASATLPTLEAGRALLPAGPGLGSYEKA